MNYLSIDIGTTGCKCQLFTQNGEIVKYLFQEYDFLALDGYHYVDIHTIEAKLREMITAVSKEYEISSICLSTLGESFVLLDKDDNVLFYPMLYTDARGEREAEEIKAPHGEIARIQKAVVSADGIIGNDERGLHDINKIGLGVSLKNIKEIGACQTIFVRQTIPFRIIAVKL